MKAYPRQRGFAVLFGTALLMMIGAGAVYSMLSTRNTDLRAERQTAQALETARDALVAFAVSNQVRPGAFPCPAINNRAGDAEADCAASAVGRVPWRTLGIPDPTDSAGESLWYALAPQFRTAATNTSAVNSDLTGNIVVQAPGSTGLTNATTAAVAVLFAPGAAIVGQTRSSTGGSACAGKTPDLCASNYLESYPAAAANAYVQVAGKTPATFNDRLLFIRTADFIPAVEMRVAAELRDLLAKYRANADCNCYPWAADWDPVNGTGTVQAGFSRGGFPTDPTLWGKPQAVPGKATPPLPAWVATNKWHRVIYYSAGKSQLNTSPLCLTCSLSPQLSVVVGGVTQNVSALLMTPGTPAAGVVRPSATFSAYFEDTPNRDAPTACVNTVLGGLLGLVLPALGCDEYVMPTATSVDRDRLVTVTTSPVTCASAAASLRNIAMSTTCGGPGNSVIAVCQTLQSQLATCGCQAAATSLVKPPCYNVSNNAHPPGRCVTALEQLQTCN